MSGTSKSSGILSKRLKFLFMGVALLIGGVGVWLGFSGETRLVCERSQAQCLLEKKGALGSEEVVVGLDEIEGARLVEVDRPDFQGPPNFRAVLDVEEGSKNLSQAHDRDQDKHQEVVDRVNEFLADSSQEQLELHDDGGMILRFMPALFLALGLLFLVGAWRG